MRDEKVVLDIEAKTYFLLQISILFLLCEKLICWRIWTADRVLPTVPYLKLIDVGPSYHLILFITSVLGLFLCFFTKNRVFILILLISELLSCLLDQNRMQPWEYQFCFILLAYLVNKDRP